MFRDAKEELERLEEALLEQEAPEDIPEEVPAQPVYRNFSNNYGRDLRNYASGYEAYDEDLADVDAVADEPQAKSLTGPVLAVCGVTLGILLAVLCWAFRLWGA